MEEKKLEQQNWLDLVRWFILAICLNKTQNQVFVYSSIFSAGLVVPFVVYILVGIEIKLGKKKTGERKNFFFKNRISLKKQSKK